MFSGCKENPSEFSKILNTKKIGKTPVIIIILLIVVFFTSCSSKEKTIFNQALDLQNNNKYVDAIGMYNDIINKYPESNYVANASVKLNQCIDLIIKQGDSMISKKDYFKAVSYYDSALRIRANDIDLQNKLKNTKNLITGVAKKTVTVVKPINEKVTTPTLDNEYNTAITALSKYKGEKIQDFQSASKILDMLKNWEYAWESRNINTYSSFYDTSFIGVSGKKTMNYNQWISYKNNLFNNYTSIQVDTLINNAILDGNKLKVYFEQWFNGYGNHPYSDHTFKEIIFVYNQFKRWVIVSEKPY